MKTHVKTIILLCAVLVTESVFGAEMNWDREAWSKGREERKICRDLAQTVASWLSDPNEITRVRCETLAKSLLQLEKPSTRAYFFASQVANLRGRPQEAIRILESVIDKYPDEKAPIGIVVPVKIVGRFWIAAIAKQSGDILRARKAYQEVLEGLENNDNIEIRGNDGIKMVCNLYLAEIEFLQMKNNENAQSHLRAVMDVNTPRDAKGESFELLKAWASYNSMVISKGKEMAALRLTPISETMSACMLAGTTLMLNGIAGEPLVSSGRELNIITKTLVDRTIENNASKIDKDLARLGYGFDQQYKGYYSKARDYYSALFNDDSFFSPVAGIFLAKCDKAQEDVDKANETLDKVIERFPGFASIAAHVRNPWK